MSDWFGTLVRRKGTRGRGVWDTQFVVTHTNRWFVTAAGTHHPDGLTPVVLPRLGWGPKRGLVQLI